jgi:hypothetical protein
VERSMFFQTVNSATRELVQTFEAISGDDLEVALARAHKAYETDGACARWPFPALPWRRRPDSGARTMWRCCVETGPSPTQGSSAPSRQVSWFGIPQPVKQEQHLTKQIERIKTCN